jgi:hypothetical protein
MREIRMSQNAIFERAFKNDLSDDFMRIKIGRTRQTRPDERAIIFNCHQTKKMPRPIYSIGGALIQRATGK